MTSGAGGGRSGFCCLPSSIALLLIGFWPTIAWHGVGGWIGVAVWWLFLIGVLVVVGVVADKRQAASPEFQDAREAMRRNREEEQRVEAALAGYVADYWDQKFAADAAQAMAKKKFREEHSPQRVWRAEEIAEERQAVEQQRKIAAGVLVLCPQCHSYAPASQGVVLAHRARGRDCGGEGLVVERS